MTQIIFNNALQVRKLFVAICVFIAVSTDTPGQCIPDNYLYHHWQDAQAFRGIDAPCYHPEKLAFSLWPFETSGNLTIKGVIPLYRFRQYQTGFEFLSTSLEEGESAGYSLQDKIGYAGKNAETGGCIPIFRFVNAAGNHFYSADRWEAPPNYAFEGIGFYAWPVAMRALKFVRFLSPSQTAMPRTPKDQKIWEEMDYIINPFEKKSIEIAHQPLGLSKRYYSPNKKIFLEFQGDGNLVLYEEGPVTAKWSTQTNGSGATSAEMQDDGNLVLYAGKKAVWDSKTCCYPNGTTHLVVQNDGNAVILYKHPSGFYVPLWSVQTGKWSNDQIDEFLRRNPYAARWKAIGTPKPDPQKPPIKPVVQYVVNKSQNEKWLVKFNVSVKVMHHSSPSWSPAVSIDTYPGYEIVVQPDQWMQIYTYVDGLGYTWALMKEADHR